MQKRHQESGVTPREETENQSLYTGLISLVEVGNSQFVPSDPLGKCDHWEFLIQPECVMSTGRKGPVLCLHFHHGPQVQPGKEKRNALAKQGNQSQIGIVWERST